MDLDVGTVKVPQKQKRSENMKKKLCIIIAAFAMLLTAGAVSAEETTDSNDYFEYNGKIYKKARDDDGNWLGYYLNEKGYVSYMSVNNYMHTVYPYPNDDTHPEVRYGSYDGYDLSITRKKNPDYIDWRLIRREERIVRYPHYSLAWNPSNFEPFYDYSTARIRIPSSITDECNKTREVVYAIEGSCAFKEFDLDPNNLYMKCVDNVIFSRDGKVLMSYAQYDERSEYSVPRDTEVIEKLSFYNCQNLKEIFIPETVTEIREYAFSKMYNLNEISLSSFDIKIDRHAFGGEQKTNARLTSCVQAKVTANENTLHWTP